MRLIYCTPYLEVDKTRSSGERVEVFSKQLECPCHFLIGLHSPVQRARQNNIGQESLTLDDSVNEVAGSNDTSRMTGSSEDWISQESVSYLPISALIYAPVLNLHPLPIIRLLCLKISWKF